MNLLHYIKGLRRGSKAHQIEKLSMADPFLYDAIEGYDSDFTVDHAEQIDIIKKRLRSISKPRASYSHIFRNIAATGAIAILGVGTYFLLDGSRSNLQAHESANAILIDIYVPEAFYESHETIIENANEILSGGQGHNEKSHATGYMGNDMSDNADSIADTSSIEIYVPEEYYNRSVENEFEIQNTDTYISPIDTLMQRRSRVKYHRSSKQTTTAPVATTVQSQYQKGSQPNKIQYTVVGEDNSNTIEVMSQNSPDIKYVRTRAIETTQDNSGYVQLVVRPPFEVEYVSKKAQKDFQDNSDRYTELPGANREYSPAGVNDPQPQCGMDKYASYLKDTLRPPSAEEKGNSKGNAVIIEFTVDDNGIPYAFRIKNGLTRSYNEEIINVILNGPRWSFVGDSNKAALRIGY